MFDACDYIHNVRHVIHCDLKPENILLSHGLLSSPGTGDSADGKHGTIGKGGLLFVAKICDFGNARRGMDARYDKRM